MILAHKILMHNFSKIRLQPNFHQDFSALHNKTNPVEKSHVVLIIQRYSKSFLEILKIDRSFLDK